MKINEMIKQKRIEQKLTQEQVAKYLGVSAPAVNKWEKGTSYPDITLLPPLARLLHTDLNTLLSFHETLTDREIALFLNDLSAIADRGGFQTAYDIALEKIRLFPTCDSLILNSALFLEGCLIYKKGHPSKDTEQYQEKIENLFLRAAESNDLNVRSQAQLISKYIERKAYEQAQTLIDQLPDAIWTDKKQLQANLFIASERYSDAAKLAEEKLLSQASELHCTLITLLEIALKEQRNEDAEYIANVSKSTATALDQWEYAAYVAHFQLHYARKERIKTLKTFLQMIRSLSKKWDLNASPLYRHIKTKSVDTAFGSTIKKTLLNSLKEEPEYDFLNISENISEDTLSELLAAEEEKELHH